MVVAFGDDVVRQRHVDDAGAAAIRRRLIDAGLAPRRQDRQDLADLRVGQHAHFRAVGIERAQHVIAPAQHRRAVRVEPGGAHAGGDLRAGNHLRRVVVSGARV